MDNQINDTTAENQTMEQRTKGERDQLSERQKRLHLTLPDSVGHVLYHHQQKLWKVKAMLAGALKLADDGPESMDVCMLIEAAIEMLDPVADSMETAAMSRDAARREISEAAEVEHG